MRVVGMDVRLVRVYDSVTTVCAKTFITSDTLQNSPSVLAVHVLGSGIFL